jgi:Protein of unknown function (DUF1194)
MCRAVVLLATLFSAVALDAASPAANLDIDLALVLAFDVSGSVSPRRFDLQREGYATAFASPQLIDAIRSTNRRAIAVTLVEWSGAYQQEQVIGWTLIEDEASSKAFGRAIAEVPRSFYGRTSISGAVDYCVALFQQSGFADQRRVIDISGDGSNNDGSPVTDARDKAVAIGLTINGLPILSEESALGDYYRDNVIGGPGSFVLEVREFSDFADAVLRKLLREIARDGDKPKLDARSPPRTRT